MRPTVESAKEYEKAMADMLVYGSGYMVDGEYVPNREIHKHTDKVFTKISLSGADRTNKLKDFMKECGSILLAGIIVGIFLAGLTGVWIINSVCSIKGACL